MRHRVGQIEEERFFGVGRDEGLGLLCVATGELRLVHFQPGAANAGSFLHQAVQGSQAHERADAQILLYHARYVD